MSMMFTFLVGLTCGALLTILGLIVFIAWALNRGIDKNGKRVTF